MMLERKLNNGVEVYALEVEKDFDEAQAIFDINEQTEVFDTEYVYTDRVSNDFVATYKIMIDRHDDYDRFNEKLYRARLDHSNEVYRAYTNMRDKLFNFYYRKGLVTRREYENMMSALQSLKRCECKMCSFNPTFDEWKAGKMLVSNGAKLGKTMRKAGFPQDLIDFYSLQVKDEKAVYLTVSDLPQHIAGMSNYAEIGTWDGYNGTSCQDTRHGYSEIACLAGSLHDRKLFVAMLHDSLEDLEDMQDKLKARTMMRYMTVNDRPCLIATTYYGNNVTKDMLHNALGKLSEVGIYSRDVKEGYNTERVYERTNGFYEHVDTIDIHIDIDGHYEVSCECPVCDGSGDYELPYEYDYKMIECPACGGSGTYETEVYVYVNEWEEMEDEVTIAPYVEGYSHDGYQMSMMLNTTEIYRLQTLAEMTEEEREELGTL